MVVNVQQWQTYRRHFLDAACRDASLSALLGLDGCLLYQAARVVSSDLAARGNGFSYDCINKT